MAEYQIGTRVYGVTAQSRLVFREIDEAARYAPVEGADDDVRLRACRGDVRGKLSPVFRQYP